MAGVFPVPVKSSGRKQWTLYSSRRNARSQLAEDGCPESQVVLAKQLLDEKTDLEIDQEENARLGVYWLMKASEQGHEEATTILRHCLETGQGITEHNYLDVKACLAMSDEEKVARRAAKRLFASMSGGDDFITTDQLHDCMKRATTGDVALDSDDGSQSSTSASSLPDWKSRQESGVEKLTEEMLVSAASNYSRGELPLVHRVVLHVDTTVHYGHTYRRHSYYLLFPLLMLTTYCNQIIDSISRQNVRYLLSIIWTNIQAALLLWILTQFEFDVIIAMLPNIIYFISLTTMIIATCQALSKKSDFHHFRRWSSLFIQYSGGNLNANEAEYQHCCNNLQPYGTFFVALLVNLILMPFMLQTSCPQSEITVIAFVCTFITLYKFSIKSFLPLSPSPSVDGGPNNKNGNNNNNSNIGSGSSNRSSSTVDLLALFSFAVHVLARYPYETDSVVSCGWRFLDVHVPTFASYVVGNGVEFCLNFRALFYLIIPAVLIKMASRDNWRGTYTSLVPHCMSLAWWQITVLSSQGATWYGLIRSALALVGFVLFLPLAGLATVLVPLVAAGKFLFHFEEQSPQLMTISAFCSVLLLIAVIIGRCKKSTPSKWNIVLNSIQVFLVILGASLLLLLMPQYAPSTRGGHKPLQDITISGRGDSVSNNHASTVLTWLQFQQLCTSPVECSRLSGLPVKWEGRVSATRLVKIYNPISQLISRLPYSMQSVIKCWYGEKFSVPSVNGNGDIPSHLLDECHLSNWDHYEYEIDTIMSSGLWRSIESSVTLIGLDNSFKNMTDSLGVGDHIWYAGSLVGNTAGMLSRDMARVDTNMLGCLICKDDAVNNVIVRKSKIMSMVSIYSGVKAILNFLFNPLVIFR
ncbi:wolframin ER transmembrane glycoprotein wfs1 isoform X2 [Lycorma delicatula]|uniref:wolframin ER transmembrane glycoprotein wfs1 isoform X2 n=1 Tax=Lycorma delicatula TaxID=130591 RepID=UPI003F513342